MKYVKYFLLLIILIISLLHITYADFTIIPRSKWGADESLQDKSKFNSVNCELNNTCNKLSKEQYDNQLNFVLQQIDLFKTKTLKEILLEKSKGIFKDISDSVFFILMENIFPDIENYSKIIRQADGYNLWWPRAYSKKISKIIIHHTAEGSKTDLNGDGIIDSKDFQLYQDVNNDGIINENDYKELVRRIYKYHTITKAWGDIGYNFIIDPAGNVYEGRAGGDYVIGGHVLYGNTDTIGVAVIGNYDIYNLNDKVKYGLINLLAELSRKYNIDPQGKSYFRNTYIYNISGHRDLNNTACPGKNIYNELDNIRSEVSNLLNKSNNTYIDTASINEDMAYKLIAQKKLNAFSDIIREVSYPIEINRPKIIRFELLNSSTVYWNTGTYVKFQPNKNVKFTDINAYLQYPTEHNRYGKFVIEVNPLTNDDIVLEGNLSMNNDHFSLQPIKLWLQRDLKDVKLKFEENNQQIQISPDIKTKIKINFKNIGTASVGKKTPNKIYLSPADDNTKSFYEPSSWILPRMITQNAQDYIDTDENGFFEFYILPSGIGNQLKFQIRSVYSDQLVNQDIITLDIIRLNNNITQTDNSGIYYKNINMNKIRVKLDFYNTKANLSSVSNYILFLDDKKIAENIDKIEVMLNKNKLQFYINKKEYIGSVIRFVPKTENEIITIDNMDKKSSTNPNIKYNQFRNILELQVENEKIIAINELSIFDYMKGVAETTPDTPYEKMKAIAMAAKNYAIYYTDKSKRKFVNKPYDLDSDPNNSQFYLGYGYEKVSNNWVKAVENTINEIIVFNNKLIKTPYFSSDNGYTKSAYDVWGWTDTPYLISVEDPYCKGMQQKGHGVGMSGCGSKGMAEAGKNYKEILQYYYSGIDIIKIE